MRKAIAGLLQTYWEFIQRHRFISFILAVFMAAACAGAFYLILANLRPWLILPCFTGGGCQ